MVATSESAPEMRSPLTWVITSPVLRPPSEAVELAVGAAHAEGRIGALGGDHQLAGLGQLERLGLRGGGRQETEEGGGEDE